MHLAWHVAVLGRVKDIPEFDTLTAKAATQKPPPPQSVEELRSRLAAWLGHPAASAEET